MSFWVNSFPAEIIVCDPDGNIVEMNQKAILLYQEEGGEAMVGRNIFDHHEEPSRSQVKSVVNQRKTTIYTAEQGGNKKLVCIAPWFQQDEYAGFTLLVLDLPAHLKNIIKDK